MNHELPVKAPENARDERGLPESILSSDKHQGAVRFEVRGKNDVFAVDPEVAVGDLLNSHPCSAW